VSTLPPPVPNSRRQSNQPPPPPGSPSGAPLRVGSIQPEDLEKASPIPIVISGVAILLSTLIILFGPEKSLIFGAVGYLLTPFITILATGIDTVSQRKKSSTYPWYVENPRYATILRILALVSLALSYPHINVLADYFSIQLAKVWPF
jgi:hypothetical protein